MTAHSPFKYFKTSPEIIADRNVLKPRMGLRSFFKAEWGSDGMDIPSEVVAKDEKRRGSAISFRRELPKLRKAYEQETNVFTRPKVTWVEKDMYKYLNHTILPKR